jgi:hypothetical protein
VLAEQHIADDDEQPVLLDELVVRPRLQRARVAGPGMTL